MTKDARIRKTLKLSDQRKSIYVENVDSCLIGARSNASFLTLLYRSTSIFVYIQLFQIIEKYRSVYQKFLKNLNTLSFKEWEAFHVLVVFVLPMFNRSILIIKFEMQLNARKMSILFLFSLFLLQTFIKHNTLFVLIQCSEIALDNEKS
jgi:hypothetical protein